MLHFVKWDIHSNDAVVARRLALTELHFGSFDYSVVVEVDCVNKVGVSEVLNKSCLTVDDAAAGWKFSVAHWSQAFIQFDGLNRSMHTPPLSTNDVVPMWTPVI